ncbi:hypothetical protein BURKHO8Y_70066 [Burkholderia sp. 8Y]|nr:hypothetical protein BURKHO8Y_70066 [Burkholderia sp. 8Y]
MRVGTVKDPEIINPHDAILRVSLSTTCGSDLHFIDGYIPTMKSGDVIGHEFMGVIEDIGPEVKRFANGDRVVVPSFIVCGQCWYCQHSLYSLCDNTHPKPELQAPLLGGHTTAGIYGYTHAFGAMRARTRNTCEYRLPTTTASRSPTASRTRQRCFLRTLFPDRLHRCRFLQHPAGRHRRSVGLRRRRADGAAKCASDGRGAGHRDRPLPRAVADGARACRLGNDRLYESRQRSRHAHGNDGRARTRRLHRRRMDGGAWHRAAIRILPRQAGPASGNGPRPGAA